MPDDPIEGVAEPAFKLQPSVNVHAPVTTFMFSCTTICVLLLLLLFMFSCSGTDVLPQEY